MRLLRRRRHRRCRGRLALLAADRAEHRAGAGDQRAFELAALQSLHQPAAADGGDAPASAAAGVGILFLKEDARAAVDQLFIGHVGFVAVEQLHQDVPPDPAEVACGDQVVVGGGAAGVGEVGRDAGADGRRHRRAHVVGIFDLQVDDAADRAAGHAQRVRRGLPGQQRAAAGRGRPARLRRALVAHLHRKAELALGGAVVARRGAERVVQIAAGDERRAEDQCLDERRARAVQPEERDAERPRGEARGDDLAVQVAAQHRLRRVGGEVGGAERALDGAADHLALGHLPALLAEQVILEDHVEPFRQRPLALLRTDDRGLRSDERR